MSKTIEIVKPFRTDKGIKSMSLLNGTPLSMEHYKRTWLTPMGIPIWYEFRGIDICQYYKAEEVIVAYSD